MNKFSSGDAVVFIWTDNADHERLIGMETEITSVDKHWFPDGSDLYCLALEDAEKGPVWAHAHCLRKKKPPEEASWDAEVFQKLNWNPTKELEDATT